MSNYNLSDPAPWAEEGGTIFELFCSLMTCSLQVPAGVDPDWLPPFSGNWSDCLLHNHYNNRIDIDKIILIISRKMGNSKHPEIAVHLVIMRVSAAIPGGRPPGTQGHLSNQL